MAVGKTVNTVDTVEVTTLYKAGQLNVTKDTVVRWNHWRSAAGKTVCVRGYIYRICENCKKGFWNVSLHFQGKGRTSHSYVPADTKRKFLFVYCYSGRKNCKYCRSHHVVQGRTTKRDKRHCGQMESLAFGGQKNCLRQRIHLPDL